MGWREKWRDTPTRMGVHGPNDRAGNPRMPTPPQIGRFRVFWSCADHEFSQATNVSNEEWHRLTNENGYVPDHAFETEEEALAAWARVRSIGDSGICHVFGILVELGDGEQEGKAPWLT